MDNGQIIFSRTYCEFGAHFGPFFLRSCELTWNWQKMLGQIGLIFLRQRGKSQIKFFAWACCVGLPTFPPSHTRIAWWLGSLCVQVLGIHCRDDPNHAWLLGAFDWKCGAGLPLCQKFFLVIILFSGGTLLLGSPTTFLGILLCLKKNTARDHDEQ